MSLYHSSDLSVKSIEVVSFHGNGRITANGSDFDASFSILRQSSRSVIILSQKELGNLSLIPISGLELSLSGTLQDGRSVKVESLKQLYSDECIIEIVPWDCAIEIGERSTSRPLRAQYTLTGLHHGNLDHEYQDWVIQIRSDRESMANARASKALQIPFDGATLTLSCSSAEKTEEDHDDFAKQIWTLLALASGNGVTCHRWIYSFSDEHELELWRPRSGDDVGPGPIIDHTGLSLFLEQCLPSWLLLSDADRHAISIAILHLNTSGSGFLDNRLLQVCQIWEFLAEEWIANQKLPSEILLLKKQLKVTLRAWKEAHQGSDDNGIISGRVLNSLDWIALLRRMNALVEAFGFQAHLIGLDLRKLKDARDAAAHSISIGASDGDGGDWSRLLVSAQTGVQLLILRKLNYSGNVIFHENLWRSDRNIEFFFARTYNVAAEVSG